ncbi:MAG: hypothetical protein GTN76_03100 [Candidatus Aenigmarchaeota archaeon]|nr:hypothetical protein [Candidatus Aenigmarchaeota archaeon]
MLNKKKMLTIFGITLLVLICFLIVLYILGVRSEAYKFALEFIKDNKLILEKIGPLKSQRLAPFGYFVRYTGPRGHAEYKILVKGEKGEGIVYIELEKSVGIWKVIRGNFVLDNGKAISLVQSRGG